MTDIVERLRNRNTPYGSCVEAAAEIERLREHVRQLATTLSEQDTAIAALEAANAAQRTEIARLGRVRIEELQHFLDKQAVEIEQLRALLEDYGVKQGLP